MAPVLPDAPPTVQGDAGSLSGQESLARSPSDQELLKSVRIAFRAVTTNPDIRPSSESGPLAPLFRQLASHASSFEKVSAKDLANLFVQLCVLDDGTLTGLRGRVEAALAKHIEGMELNPPVVQPGFTPAGVRAAFVDRLSALKDDVEALSLLTKDIGNLPEEVGQRRTQAIVKALPKVIAKLAEVMWQGKEEISPKVIAKAVAAARLAHETLLKLNPEEPSDLEAFLTADLLTHSEKSLREAELILMGKAETAEGERAGVKDAANAVSVAIQRRNAADTPGERETMDLQLFGRALGYAIKPRWVEPSGAGEANSANLFGDERMGWPTVEVGSLATELRTSTKGWNPGTKLCCEELLKVLQGIHDIRKLSSISQLDAVSRAALLHEPISKYSVHEPLGNQKLLYRWDVPSLSTLSPQDRATKLRDMLEPARIGVQRRIVEEVNAGRTQAKAAVLDAATKKDRLARQAAARELERRKKAGE